MSALSRRLVAAGLLAMAIGACAPQKATAQLAESTPKAVFLFCADARMRKRDCANGAGNPFASAVIQAIESNPANLDELLQTVRTRTRAESFGDQVVVIENNAPVRTVSILGPQRIALVLMVSDYAGSGLESLPGVAHDAERLRTALEADGFVVSVVRDPSQ